MEALVLGIDNSLIPVEIGTCNEIYKYLCLTVKLHNLHTDQSEHSASTLQLQLCSTLLYRAPFVRAVNFIDYACEFYKICFAENNENLITLICVVKVFEEYYH